MLGCMLAAGEIQSAFFTLWSTRQSCARACCGASLRWSRCASTSLRYSLSRPHRGTRCVRFALSARTTAMRMMTKRAARAALKGPFLGIAEAHRSPPERSFAERLLVFGAAANTNATSSEAITGCEPPRCYFDGGYFVFTVATNRNTTSSRESVPGGGDFCGGEERRAEVGARSALRKLTHCGCPSVESEANKASSAVRPRTEHRSAVAAKRRPPQHEPPPGTDSRDASTPIGSC